MSMAAFLEGEREKAGKKKVKGRGVRQSKEQGSNCTLGVFYWVLGGGGGGHTVRTAAPAAGHESQLKPGLGFIPQFAFSGLH